MISTFTVRLVLGFIILLKALIYIPHRLKADKSKDNLNRRETEGSILFYTLRISGFVFLFSYVAYLFFPAYIATFLVRVPVFFQVLGLGMELTTLFLSHWILGTLGKNMTDTVKTRTNHQLVTTGIYQYIQHPLYTSALLSVIGVSLMTGNLLILLSGLILLTAIYVRTPIEEQFLKTRFGQTYIEYVQKTGRFFPNF